MPGSGNVLVDAIAGVGWLSRGGDRNITFFFDNSFGFHNWTTTEQNAFRAALQQYANVANITIQQVGSSAGADLSEMWVSDAYMRANFGDFAGLHQYPSTSPPAFGAYNFDGRPYFTTSGLAGGGYGLQVFLHEIGPGLGLAHTHDTDLGTGVLPGVTSPSSLGTLDYNQDLYSLMSYNNGPRLSSGSNDYGHASTPMAFDVAAIQFLYGANNSYHTGADTYLIPDTNSAGTSWQCIWDAGGADWIAYHGARDVTIDLRAATLVNGDPNAGGFVSAAAGIFGGFTIANGVVIENAWGGIGNDTIAGSAGNNLLLGDAGNDTFIFSAGADTIDGGPGDDRALYSGNLSSYTVTDLGTSIAVLGSVGTYGLTSVEHLQFADGTINPDDGNRVFDTVLYDVKNPDVFHAGADALGHYNANGWREGRDPNSVFSTNFYLGVNRDVLAAGANPLDHYHLSGWKEGRDPSASFDTGLYLKNNPDVAAANLDPLEHYLMFGRAEGRAIYAAIGPVVAGFDAEYYLSRYPDIAFARVDPQGHFSQYGWREGRSPNAVFDTAGYLAHYADVRAAGIDPLQHYELFGWREGRDPSASFDTRGYLAANPDVAAAGVNPLDHYLMFGIYEGRTVVNDGVWR
jgi:serralysin